MSRRDVSSAPAKLLEAATAAFAELGFHGVSTRDIAARAGLSPSAMYAHYASKEELLYDVSIRGHEGVLAAIREASATGVTPSERLGAVSSAFARWHAHGNVRAHVVNYELGSLSEEHRAEVVRLRTAIDQVFRSVVEAGVHTGEFSVDDVSMTALTLASLGVDVARWYRPDGEWSVEAIAAHASRTALRIVGSAQVT